MPQAGIITIPLEAVFIYGIGNINKGEETMRVKVWSV